MIPRPGPRHILRLLSLGERGGLTGRTRLGGWNGNGNSSGMGILRPTTITTRAYTSPPSAHPQPQSQSQPTTQPQPNPASQPHQQPHQQTYYTLFPRTLPLGPPPRGPFSIHPRELRKEYLALQQQYHPDLLRHQPAPSPSPNPPPTHAHPPISSSLLSKAYSTLLDPLLRAEYILSLAPSPNSPNPPSPSPPPSLLTEVLLLREAIEDAAEARDTAGLEALARDVEGRIATEERAVGEALEGGDWEGAREGVGRWRYWRSMLGRLGELEEGGG